MSFGWLKIKQLDRSLDITLQIDTNRINARGQLASMNQLEKWHEDEVIHLEMSEVAQNEAIAGRNPRRTEKAFGYIFSETFASSPREQERLRKIEKVLFPHGAEDQSQRNDVEIVFNAYKYADGSLVTADGNSKKQPGGILGHKKELSELGISVMSAEEAILFVCEKIQQRDVHVLRRHEKHGAPLPDWFGKD